MAFEWLVRMQDMVSDPASRIERQLNRVDQALKAVSIQAKQTSLQNAVNPLKRMNLELQIQRDKLLIAKKAMEQHGGAASTLTGWIKHTREAMRDWMLILYPLTAGLRMVFNAAERMAQGVVGAVRAREDAIFALTTSVGSSARGIADDIQNFALRSGRSVDKMYDEAAKFARIGMPADYIAATVRAIADIDKMGGSASKLEMALTNMWSEPVLHLKEFQNVLAGVVDESKYWQAMSKEFKVPVGDVNRMVTWNLAQGRRAYVALIKLIQEQAGGSLGKISVQYGEQTLGGLLDRFSQRLEKLLAGIADTPGFKTFKKALENLLKVLGGREFQKVVTDISNTLGAILEPLTGPTGRKKMEEFFKSMEEWIKKILPSADGLGKAFRFFKGMGVILEGVRHPFTSKTGPGSPEKDKLLDDALGNKSPEKAAADYILGRSSDKEATSDLVAKRLGQGNEAVDRAARKVFHIDKIEIRTEVNAHGATKDDAQHIGDVTSDKVRSGLIDTLEQINDESP